jgi:uncharacterized membrane protein YeaQ/YmgE (transglycosylase-associated protein family)
MRGWVIIVLAIAVGIVGAWVGYWLGHALGWTTNAEWPLRIGGGDRAILLSMGLSFLSVVGAGGLLVARPIRRERRLLATGRQGRATILKVWRTGLSARGFIGGTRSQLGFDLEVHAEGRTPYTVHTTAMVSSAEANAFAPGAEVAIRYDPSKPTHVAVEGLVAPSPA